MSLAQRRGMMDRATSIVVDSAAVGAVSVWNQRKCTPEGYCALGVAPSQ